MNWYEKDRQFIQSLYGDDWQLICALLSATGPQVNLKTSWRWTIAVYRQYKAGRKIDLSPFMSCHRRNVLRALAGVPLSGRKVRNFYRNLIGDENAVTLDTWMLNLFGWYDRHKRVPSNNQYDRLAERFRNVARRNGHTPATFQAMLWVKIRERAGHRPVSYSIAGVDARQGMLFDVDYDVPF